MAQTVKNLPAMRETGFNPWVRKILWRRECNPLQYSCLQNSKDRGALHLSAMSAKELIEDHITVIWDNLTGRDTYVSVEERLSEDGDAFGVVGITEEGEEIDLDFSLDF